MAGSQDLGTIANMIRKCGPQIFACVNDPDCKAALDCLQGCGPTDQVRLTPVRVHCACRASARHHPPNWHSWHSCSWEECLLEISAAFLILHVNQVGMLVRSGSNLRSVSGVNTSGGGCKRSPQHDT